MDGAEKEVGRIEGDTHVIELEGDEPGYQGVHPQPCVSWSYVGHRELHRVQFSFAPWHFETISTIRNIRYYHIKYGLFRKHRNYYEQLANFLQYSMMQHTASARAPNPAGHQRTAC